MLIIPAASTCGFTCSSYTFISFPQMSQQDLTLKQSFELESNEKT